MKTLMTILANLPENAVNTKRAILKDLLVDTINLWTEEGTDTYADECIEAQSYYAPLVESLNESGFKVLGCGYFSMAVTHEVLPKEVFKVGLKKEDSGAAYTAWCRANQGKAGVPIIYGVSRHESCYIVNMKRYEQFPWWDEENGHMFDVYQVIESMSYQGGKVSNYAMKTYGSYLEDSYKVDLVQTFKEIYEFFDGIATFDLHSGNVMLDEHGQLIITDPVSFSHGKLPKDKFNCGSLDELKEDIKKQEELRKQKEKATRLAILQVKEEGREAIRNENAARLFMGTAHWQSVIFKHSNESGEAIEKEQHEKLKDHDLIAMMFGNDIFLDKKLDNEFLQG